MQIPTLPTDNLYKFLAIAGLVLIIASNFYFEIFSLEVLNKTIENKRDLEILNKEQDYLIEDYENSTSEKEKISAGYNQLAEELKKHSNQDAANNQTKSLSELNEKKAEQDKLSAALKEKNREINLKSIKQDAIHESTKSYVWYLNRMSWMRDLGQAIGVVLLVTGLFLWYTRAQKLQDQILKNEANKYNSDRIDTTEKEALDKGLDSRNAVEIEKESRRLEGES